MSIMTVVDVVGTALQASPATDEQRRDLAQLMVALPPHETMDAGLQPWLDGGSVERRLFGRFDARAERLTVVGALAVHNQDKMLRLVLEHHGGRGEDLPAIHTPVARIGLVEYLCMSPRIRNTGLLQDAISTLNLGASQLQPVADRLFSRSVWLAGKDEASLVSDMHQHEDYWVQAMAVLAAHGAKLDRSVWAKRKTDLLAAFMGTLMPWHRYASAVDPLARLQAIDALAEQGFGRVLAADVNCPVYCAARLHNYKALGILLDHGFRHDRKGPGGTALNMLVKESRVQGADMDDGLVRCLAMLRSAVASHQADKALAELHAALDFCPR